MIIYFAGIPGAPEQTEHKLNKLNRLFSFFDLFPHKGGGRMYKTWKIRIA